MMKLKHFMLKAWCSYITCNDSFIQLATLVILFRIHFASSLTLIALGNCLLLMCHRVVALLQEGVMSTLA